MRLGKGADYIVVSLAERIVQGELEVILSDGSRHLFQGKAPGPRAQLRVLQPRAVRRILSGGSLGFAEAYMEGEIESDDLAKLLHLLACNRDAWDDALRGKALYRMVKRAYHLLRPNSRGGAKRNILAHYDLGNSFYETWLDETFTYSSALFEQDNMSLSDAQQAKYRRLAEMAQIREGEHTLEIGCGWGGFAEFAGKEIGAKVTAITISDAQYDFARQRIHQAGLNERVEVVKTDYRDIRQSFDKVVSIEMFEAVGEAYWPAYFGKVRESLKPGGKAALQIITIADHAFDQYRRSVDFIQRYVFPGGMLPSVDALRDQVAKAGLEWREDHGYGIDYARTLSAWHDQFEQAWPQISTLGFDERFRRLWKYYLAYCEAGFRTGRIDLKQIALAKQ